MFYAIVIFKIIIEDRNHGLSHRFGIEIFLIVTFSALFGAKIDKDP